MEDCLARQFLHCRRRRCLLKNGSSLFECEIEIVHKPKAGRKGEKGEAYRDDIMIAKGLPDSFKARNLVEASRRAFEITTP